MELANLWTSTDVAGVFRVARLEDARDITWLLQRASYSHVHIDWHPLAHWLASPGFVVYEQRPLKPQFLEPHAIQACLAVVADPPPVAWVRAAGILDKKHPQAILHQLITKAREAWQGTAVTHFAWLAIEEWPNAWLNQLGFYLKNEIETYVKEEMTIPAYKSVSGLTIRPAETEDLEQLAEIETAAFEPLWRFSAQELAVAYPQRFHFDVACLNGRIVGYQFSTQHGYTAHLVRLTVAPDQHQQGIGSFLLAHAIQTYQQANIRKVSLNTQVDNIASQILYQKFGFQSNHERFCVWMMDL